MGISRSAVENFGAFLSFEPPDLVGLLQGEAVWILIFAEVN